MPTKRGKLRRKREARKTEAASTSLAREPNGRLQRDAKPETEKKLMAVVLAQPHRRGNRDQRCESALGRMVIGLKLPDAYFRAGEEFAAIYRRWRLAKGLAVGHATEGKGGSVDPTPEEISRLSKALVASQNAIIEAAGYKGYSGVRSIVIEGLDLTLTSESEGATIDGLHALAIHYGMIDARAQIGYRVS